LLQVFEHLRTLLSIVSMHVPRDIVAVLPRPGEVHHTWHEGTLMFTDLAGFTRFVATYNTQGRDGATTLLAILNAYFATMIDIIHQAGGTVHKFAGDGLLVQFAADRRHHTTVRAVRAGLRMQRAMAHFTQREITRGPLALAMRIGIHTGRFLVAHIGTPQRMEYVLLGPTVVHAKHAEGAGAVGRVCLTAPAYAQVREHFRSEPGSPGYVQIIDDLTVEQLGAYDLAPVERRSGALVLLDRRVDGLLHAITEAIGRLEPLVCYLPGSLLQLLVEHTAHRHVPPTFPVVTVLFVNVVGLPEAVAQALPDEEGSLMARVSWLFARINAAVEAQGGVLQRITCQVGTDIMIHFGMPPTSSDDTQRAVRTALAIRDIITHCAAPLVGQQPQLLTCKMGLARGSAFAAEVGMPRGRREFDIHGEAINTAAHLLQHAASNQILLTEDVAHAVAEYFDTVPLPALLLKGAMISTPVFALCGKKPSATEFIHGAEHV
jgi:class 3 adenylate cyclase